MSLNGLDVDAVIEAHHSALADPGGWFLLKYANRDTVEVLGRGHGGVAEAKSSVEQYMEKSPLYGMVQYRRKRVLLKYVPEGTSRLLQVRLTVQFQSILDAFAHDTIFSFTAAAELVDSAIGMCTMLLPANPGSLKSSNSSLRQRRLNEISEDSEDFNTTPRKQDTSSSTIVRPDTAVDKRVLDDDLSTLPASAIRAKALLAKRKEERRQESLSYSNPMLSQDMLFPVPPTDLPPNPSDSTRLLGSLSQLKLRDEADSAARSIKSNAPSTDQILQRIHHSRHLSENENASISQWNDQVTAYVPPEPFMKPKKKLAPRPHIESQARPKTANTYEETTVTRPIANLPHTVRVSGRQNASSHSLVRPGSQQSSRSVPARFLPSLPSPNLPPPLPDFGQLELFKRPESRQAGSVVSSAVTDAPNASPEKLRLMKALQKRKRTQLLSSRAASAQSSFATDHDDFPMGHRQAKESSVMTTTIKEETTPVVQDSRSVNVSSTASPTSIGTMSDDPSTRPSSFDEDHKSQNPQKSPSRDTDSSSTPKAIAVNARSASNKHMSWFDSAPDFNEGSSHGAPSTITPQKHAMEEEFDRNTDTPTPRNPQIEPAAPQQDKSTLSWLASDSQLNVLQSLVQIADAPSTDIQSRKHSYLSDAPPTDIQSRKHSYLSVGSPMLTTSSMMSDDDPLVQEIRGATVHEATSMSVKRPPLTPTMRTVSVERVRLGTRSDADTTPRSNRSPLGGQDNSPTGSEQSLSTALPPIPAGLEEERMPVPLSKKTTLGQGISQRIKALEDSSRRDTGMSSSPSAHDSSITRSTFTNLMKRTSFIAQLTASASNDKPSSQQSFKAAVASQSTDKSRGAQASGPRRNNNTEKRVNTSDTQNAQTGILTGHDQSQAGQLKLQTDSERQNTHVPILLDAHVLDVPSTPTSVDKKRFSFTSYRSGTTITSTKRWMHSEPMNSRTSLTNKEKQFPRAPASETSSVHEDKRSSRASRLMKRVSGIGSRLGSKTQLSISSREDNRPDPIIEQHENHGRPESVASSSTLQMIDIGNVNVQFPETLLWKRRFLRIDDQGYLIFTAPSESHNSRATNRKFHLGDIQEPCLPDSEREQVAWSILLDLRDGNCIQCACGSKQGQKKVLNMLLDAHGAYHSLYPDALE